MEKINLMQLFKRFSDELLMVSQGIMSLKLMDTDGHLYEGELVVVPRGVEHQPVAESEALIMLFEPAETAHTGNIECEQTVDVCERI